MTTHCLPTPLCDTLKEEEEEEEVVVVQDKLKEEKEEVEIYGIEISSKDALLAMALFLNGLFFGPRNSNNNDDDTILFYMVQIGIWVIVVILHGYCKDTMEEGWRNVVMVGEGVRRDVATALFFLLGRQHDDDDDKDDTSKTESKGDDDDERYQNEPITSLKQNPQEATTTTTNQNLETIATSCPSSTLQEQQRFLKARKHNVQDAIKQLNGYLSWRDELDLDTLFQKEEEDWRRKKGVDGDDDDEMEEEKKEEEEEGKNTHDEKDWIMASKAALAYETKNSTDTTPQPPPQQQLPQLVFTHTSPSTSQKILHVLPARLNLLLAPPQTYSLSIAIYLDHHFSRTSLSKSTIVIDLRGGNGWSNPRPTAAIPFIKSVSSLLERHFPERLDRCVLYPLPRPMSPLWNVIRKFLDVDTANKMCVCFGGGNIGSPVPKSVGEYLEEDVLVCMEQTRRSLFC